jgi:hypothetical protein
MLFSLCPEPKLKSNRLHFASYTYQNRHAYERPDTTRDDVLGSTYDYISKCCKLLNAAQEAREPRAETSAARLPSSIHFGSETHDVGAIRGSA